MKCTRRGRGFVLIMAAREADGSDLADVGLFRYFILADARRARNDRPAALITGVGGEVKVALFHRNPHMKNSYLANARLSAYRLPSLA
jgi:hypothetical protein